MEFSINYKIYEEVAAGGVVIKKNKSGIFFAIVYRNQMNDVVIPKGHQKKGEDLLKTALREVKEETGFIATPVRYLTNTRYTVKDSKKKAILIRPVYWFLMKYKSGSPRKKNKEVIKVEWIPLSTAGIKLLSYPNERKVVGLAAKDYR